MTTRTNPSTTTTRTTTARANLSRSSSGGSIKEKRGLSPSSTPPKKTITRASSDIKPTTTTKQLPNYLKPTLSISSRSDQPDQTTTPLRRRSFDKPPSPSHKPPVRTLTKSATTTSMRSNSSFASVPSRLDRSATSVSSRRSLGGLDSRSGGVGIKTPKGIKPQGGFSSSRSVKKKKECSSNNNVNGGSPCSSVSNLDDIEGYDELENKESENVVDVDDKNSEGSCVVEVEGDNVESEEKLQREEVEVKQVNTHEIKVKRVNTHVSEKVNEEKEGKMVNSQECEVKYENRRVEEVVLSPVVVTPSTPSTPSRMGGGRRESPSAYNDVIEETASKLLEKRKNKVKALAGAFETVIAYESGSYESGSK